MQDFTGAGGNKQFAAIVADGDTMEGTQGILIAQDNRFFNGFEVAGCNKVISEEDFTNSG